MWIGAVAIRVIAAIGLLVYPRVSDSDLTGWDAERFQEIAEIDGRPWADVAVEYPPGTVILAEALAGDTPVDTNDRLVLLSLAVDLMIAAVLRLRWTPTAAVAYLIIGLPLVPAGLLRFDLWAAFAAVMALSELRQPEPHQAEPQHETNHAKTSRLSDLRFASWVVVGAMIKVWPVLVVAAAIAVRRTRAGATALALGSIAGVLWLSYAGVDAPRQVLSLRDATGWQLETIGGSLTGLFTDAEVTLQNDAYRIGTLSPTLVTVGRLVTLAAIAAVVVRTRRSVNTNDATTPARVMLAATAAMIVTAPLLSPQFLLWLTPFAAICWPSRAAGVATLAIVITGLTGPIFGYENLANPLPAAILLGRDALLVGVIVLASERQPHRSRVGIAEA